MCGTVSPLKSERRSVPGHGDVSAVLFDSVAWSDLDRDGGVCVRSDGVRHQTSPSQTAQFLGDGRLVSDTIRPVPVEVRRTNHPVGRLRLGNQYQMGAWEVVVAVASRRISQSLDRTSGADPAADRFQPHSGATALRPC